MVTLSQGVESRILDEKGVGDSHIDATDREQGAMYVKSIVAKLGVSKTHDHVMNDHASHKEHTSQEQASCRPVNPDRLVGVSSHRMDRYISKHSKLAGPGDARPTAQEIIQDEGLENKWAEKVLLVTGVSSGLGVETARALSTTGASLYLTARSLDKARQALGDLAKDTRVHLLQLDLESLASVRACAASFLAQSSQLNILITNAGIRHVPFELTKDGFEKHLGVNHLSHFLLMHLLLPALIDSSTPNFKSRVVALSSTAHRNTPIHFDDLNLSKESVYTPPVGYAQSKLANVYMTNEITRRHARDGVFGLAVHPGGIRTGLQNQPGKVKELLTWYYVMNIRKVLNIMKNVEQGAATSVWAATAKCLEGKGGLYLEDCLASKPAKQGWAGVDPGYVERSFDVEAASRLWDLSCELVGISKD